MRKYILRKLKHRPGFTLTEILLVIGILAVTAAIAIPSLISVHRTTQLRKRDDYAKAIYLAAQDNLNQMRAAGELGLLQDAADGLEDIPADLPAAHIPGTVSSSFLYSYSQPKPDAEQMNPSYDLIVPGSVDSTIRSQHVIIEYSPKAGIVYSVFYYEDADILELYSDAERNGIIRGIEGTTGRQRRSLGVGYYSVENLDGLEEAEFALVHAGSQLSFTNAQESYLTLRLPMLDDQNNTLFDEHTRYLNGLEVELTVTGENGGTFTKTYIPDTAPYSEDSAATPIPFEYDNAAFTVFVDIPLDALRSGEGFAQQAENQNAGGTDNLIAAGDNVTVTADVTFYPSAAQTEEEEDDPIILIDSATLAGINPMFHALTRDPEAAENDASPYILAISNGRHLQNLAYVKPAFAEKLQSIVFTHPEQEAPESGEALVLDWAETAAYYATGSNPLTLKPIDFTGVSSVTNSAVRKLLINGNDVTIANLTVDQATSGGNAGLFGRLSNVEIKDIELQDPKVDAAASAAGALAGRVENTVITDCQVDNEDSLTYISGSSYAGGLVGHASAYTEMTNCVTGANVNGENGSQTDVGGLVGYARAATFTNCRTEDAAVESGTPSGSNYLGHRLGGLVGYADSGARFLNCSTDAGTSVTSSQNAVSDIGGFVGHASGAQFGDSGNANQRCTSLAEVHSSAHSTAGTIPNTNLGGFVGESVTSSYYYPSVSQYELPAFAADAGGFAGVLRGGQIHDLRVTINAPAIENGARSVTRFGGIASFCTGGAKVNGAIVDLEAAEIRNVTERAAGAFAIVENDSKISDVQVYQKDRISGANANAGFAVTVRSGVEITESSFRGPVASGGSGFVCENAGSIQRCYANPTLSNGRTFVHTNDDGEIRNCFGWAKGQNTNSIGGKCSYSYFGTYDDDRNIIGMVLYEGLNDNGTSQRSTRITDTEALADIWAVELLNNGQNPDPWEEGDNDYPYPTLVGFPYELGHAKPSLGSYPYALRYVETYSDATTGEVLVKFNEEGTVTSVTDTGLSLDKVIQKTEYTLCHRTDLDLGNATLDRNDGDAFTAAFNQFGLNGTKELYSIYTLTEGETSPDLKLNTRYPLYNKEGAYRIRTADQFARIPVTGSFYVDRNITIAAAIPEFRGSLTGVNGAVITTSGGPLVAQMTGGSITNLTAQGIAGNPIVVIAGKQVSGVTHSSETRNETKKVSRDDLAKYTAVAETQAVTDVVVSGCKIGETDAVKNPIYYYTIATDLSFHAGAEQTASLQSRTFRDLYNSRNEAGTASTYYLKDGMYASAEVTMTYTEANAETEAPAQYTFAIGSDTVILTEDALDTSEANGITLYRLANGSVLTLTGCYQLHCDGGYLAATDSGFEAVADGSALSTLWIGDGNGQWTNLENEAVTLTAKAVTGSDKVISITGSASLASSTFAAAPCETYYECTYLGMNYDMFIPG